MAHTEEYKIVSSLLAAVCFENCFIFLHNYRVEAIVDKFEQWNGCNVSYWKASDNT